MILSDRMYGAMSAYSKHTFEVCTRLAAAGHRVAHIPMGFTNFMGKSIYRGVLVYESDRESPFGEKVAVQDYIDFKADLLITNKEPWVFQDLHKWAINFVPMAIIDHAPVSLEITRRLHTTFKTIAISRFGQRELQKAGLESIYIPVGVRTDIYKPYDKAESKKAFFLNPDEFVVGIVAMNRCFPAGVRILTPNGYENIENITKGDEVVSGEGNIKTVLNVFQRKADEEFVTIRTQGLSPIKCTSNHEIYAVKKSPKELPNRSISLSKLYQDNLPSKIKALDLAVGDYVVVPITQNFNDVFLELYGKVGIRLDQKMARLIGYYLAEGFVAKTGSSAKFHYRTVWTFHKDETEYIDEVRSLCLEIFDSPTSIQKVDNVCHIILYGKEIAAMFKRYFGRTSRQKTIGPMFQAKPELQLEMFKTYWNGDGSIEVRRRIHKCASVGSYSEKLLQEMQAVLIRNHVWANFHCSKDGENNSFSLNIHNRECKKLFPISIEKEKSSAIVYPKYVLVRIKQLYRTSEKIPVYDFEVADDHNYIAGNLKVSNSRKMIPQMLRGYKRFLELNPDIKSKMMLWTNVLPSRPPSDTSQGVADVGVNLTSEIYQLGLGENVNFVKWDDIERMGGIPDFDPNGKQDMVRLYNSFDVNLLCSGGEGAGLPYLEANACGVPSLYTNYAAAPEYAGPSGIPVNAENYVIINTPGTRFYLADIDGIAEGLRKIYDADRVKLAKRCRAFAEKMSWDNIIKDYWIPFLSKCEEELYPKVSKTGYSSWGTTA